MFTKNTFQFLDELAANNTRTWFEANKKNYELLVREPALDFIEAMAPVLEKIAPAFRAEPRKVGGSLMRVYRDTRFSRDKRRIKPTSAFSFVTNLAKMLMRRVFTCISPQMNVSLPWVVGIPKPMPWVAYAI